MVFRYFSYSILSAEHAVHRLRRCPAFARARTCLFLSVQQDITESVSHGQNGWPHDHGPTNVRAMVKTNINQDQQNINKYHQRSTKVLFMILIYSHSLNRSLGGFSLVIAMSVSVFLSVVPPTPLQI